MKNKFQGGTAKEGEIVLWHEKANSNFQVWNKSIRSTPGHDSAANKQNSLRTASVLQKRKTDQTKVQKQLPDMKKIQKTRIILKNGNVNNILVQ